MLFRSYDGTGNNAANPLWGTTGSQLIRLAPADYADNKGELRDGPAPRDVSDIVFDQPRGTSIPDPSGLNDLWTTWGQFLDHDLDLTPDNAQVAGQPEIVVIDGVAVPLNRSGTVAGSGIDGPREFPNVVSAYIDGSMVYGSDATRASALRAFEGGRLLVSQGVGDGDLLPLNTFGIANAGQRPGGDPLFVAGDVRANENAVLTTLHTLFVREHNHWADRLAAENPLWSDEQIYRMARAIVGAEIQNITYSEYLAPLIGEDALAAYDGYDPGVDAGVSIEFSTTAFRFGHSTVSSTIGRRAEDGSQIAAGDITVAEAFFNNEAIAAEGIDDILRGLGAEVMQKLDAKMIHDMRNVLISAGGDTDLDLAALNILRGRDHGIGTYNDVRAALGLAAAASFADVTSDPALAAALETAYGTVDALDLWVAGLAEDPVEGAVVGETFRAILVDQFERSRDGDAFWFELQFADHPKLLAEIRDTSLSDIIERVGGVDVMQADAFTAFARIGGTDGGERLNGTASHDLMVGEGGDDVIVAGRGDDEAYGGGGDDRVFGLHGDDTLRGGRGDDRIGGGTGDDFIVGGTGADDLFGGTGDDVVHAGSGADTVLGGAGDDMISGAGGADLLFGQDGDDLLVGGGGADVIVGGRGDDVLAGGAGADVFVFRPGSGADVVRDFTFGEDGLHVLNVDHAAASMAETADGTLIEVSAGGDTVLLEGAFGLDTSIFADTDPLA